ncbi:MAG: radical SAM protein [Halioglobus sp.]|nr:radical SAM protein [Halioglobus sp.]
MNESHYLSPGFLVTLGERRGALKFPLFDGRLRKATPARLALVDTLNRGYTGDTSTLLEDLADRFGVQVGALRTFFDALSDGGYLSSAPPPARFASTSRDETAPVGEGEMTIAAPASLLSQGGEYFWYDHHGKLLLTLNLPQLLACSCFTQKTTASAAWERHRNETQFEALGREAFDELLRRLRGVGLLIDAGVADKLDDTPLYGTVNIERLHELVDARVAEHDREVADSGRELVQVVPVNTRHGIAPQSLGMLMAYAMEYEGGRLCGKYDFVPMFYTDESRMVERAERPGIFLFSNYLWNLEENLKISAAIKSVSPDSITLHGGPSTPKYEPDAEAFFAENPHVDIAIRGEGELTMADVLDKLDIANSRDLGVLDQVEGLSYRGADGSVVRTGDRERISDLDTIPSPLLMGLFNEFGSMKAAAIIETNRGCPYGCTFCDWGSATLSRVRKFDLDRVFAELEWSAQHQIEDAAIADANFGMLERDVEIAEKIADLKREYGYPRTVNINYAKNQVRYLRKIIEIFSEVDILAEGVVSLQSMDETTLKVIDRANIKLDKYNELATEFRRSKLPLAADIMMGLPGSTPDAFRRDLQQCTDRDIRVRANYTQLLPNSPMNDPDYRIKHGIRAKPGRFSRRLRPTRAASGMRWTTSASPITCWTATVCSATSPVLYAGKRGWVKSSSTTGSSWMRGVSLSAGPPCPPA